MTDKNIEYLENGYYVIHDHDELGNDIIFLYDEKGILKEKAITSYGIDGSTDISTFNGDNVLTSIESLDEKGKRVKKYYNNGEVTSIVVTEFEDNKQITTYYKGDNSFIYKNVSEITDGVHIDTRYDISDNVISKAITETSEDGSQITKEFIANGTLIMESSTDSSGGYEKILYNLDGTRNMVIESDGNGIHQETYYKNGKLDYAVKSDEKNNHFTRIKYDNRYPTTFVRYKSYEYDNDKLIRMEEHGEKLEYSCDYEYDEQNRIIKKTIYSLDYDDYEEEFENTSIETYTYDSNGKVKCKNEIFVDDNKIMEFNNNNIFVSQNKKKYSFYIIDDKNYYHPLCTLNKEDGTLVYILGDENLSLYKDGKYELSNGHSGEYYYDVEGNIICNDGINEYTYDNCGQLIKEKKEDKIIEYDLKNKKETIICDDRVTYSMINHIEYNELEYEKLMKGLIEISDSNKIDSICDNINNRIRELPDKYDVNKIISIKMNEKNHLKKILKLQKNINYSLLAYQTCDNDLYDMANHLIDNLFVDNETNLSKMFRSNIDLTIEDRNLDGIKEYKEDTNFSYLYANVIPAYKYNDDDGNVWYFNKKKNLISATGNNLKISYGNEEFKVSFTNNGAVKLIDSNNNPINIYGDYNIDSCQYGGNQEDFYSIYSMRDEDLLLFLDKYYPESSYEEKKSYLNGVCETGCGNTAITNMVFKEFEGKEEEFYDTFGYPMYNIKMNDDGSVGGVDYNYENLTLELFTCVNGGTNITGSVGKSDGTNSDEAIKMYNYLHDKYHIFPDDYKEYSRLCGCFADEGYDLYNLDKTLYIPNGDAHAMIKIGETEDGYWIVSTWGKKLLCKPSNMPYNLCDGEDVWIK